MNSDQIIGPARIAIAWLVSWFITAGYIPAGWEANATALGVFIILLAWSVWDHSTSRLLDRVASNPEVKQVVVTPSVVFSTDNPKVVAK